MSDDTARAVGASGSTTVLIAGKECTARPLSIRELAEVERICVDGYKDDYLATVGRSIKRLPDKSRRNAFMEEEIIKAANWTIKDLPKSEVFDASRIDASSDLRLWLKETFSLNGQNDDNAVKRMAASALDQGMLSNAKYEEMTGKKPPSVSVPYINWWITGCFDGILTLVWIAFRDAGVTKDEVSEAVGQNMNLLTQLAHDLEKLSAPAAGNG